MTFWVTFLSFPGCLFSAFFPCWNDSAADYPTQTALIAATNWKESIPDVKHICLPVQKLASVPHLTSSGKGAKKPLCCRPLNSALNLTLERIFPDEETEDVEKNHPALLFLKTEGDRPRGKSWKEIDGNSSEPLMHSFVWLVQDLRDCKSLVKGETKNKGFCSRSAFHAGLPEQTLIEEQHLTYWWFCYS